MREGVERIDQDLADERRDSGRGGECGEGPRQRPPVRLLGSALGMQPRVPAQAPRRPDQVDQEQHSRDRKGRDRQRVTIGVARPARDRRNQEQQHGQEHERQLAQQRTAVERAPAVRPGGERDAQHQQQVRDDAPGQRPAHDIRQPVGDGEQGDDQLGRVAEARVQETADARPGVFPRVFGRLADQPRQRHQRRSREDEQRDVADVEDVTQQEGDGSQDE